MEITHDGRNRPTKPRKDQNARRKGNLQVLWNIENKHDQSISNDKKKSISGELETTRNETIKQIYHQRNIHLGCTPKILGTILEVDEGKALTNRTGIKKTNNDA